MVTVTDLEADVEPCFAVMVNVALEFDILLMVNLFPSLDQSADDDVQSHSMVSGFESPDAVHVAGRLFIVILDDPLILAIRIRS